MQTKFDAHDDIAKMIEDYAAEEGISKKEAAKQLYRHRHGQDARLLPLP